MTEPSTDGRDRGQKRSWRARITQQLLDRIIAQGVDRRGAGMPAASGRAGQPDVTMVTLELDMEPDGPLEAAGDALGIVRGQVESDLDRFKAFIEERGQETGAWRGAVGGDTVASARRSS
jgi:hypothetical protein